MASAASIRDRLKNFAKASNADVGMLIKRYGGEAIMRRVAMHDRADAFILKGASLFAMTDQALVRTTADVDFGIKLCVSGLGELEDLMRGILAQDASPGRSARMSRETSRASSSSSISGSDRRSSAPCWMSSCGRRRCRSCRP